MDKQSKAKQAKQKKHGVENHTDIVNRLRKNKPIIIYKKYTSFYLNKPNYIYIFKFVLCLNLFLVSLLISSVLIVLFLLVQCHQ